MKTLSYYINNKLYQLKLSETDKIKLLELDREFGELIELYRKDRNWKNPLNIEEEMKKFFLYRSKGEKYYPVLKFEPCKFCEDGILDRMVKLFAEFNTFNCPLSKYYIDNLNNYIFKVKYTIQKITDNPKITYKGDNGYDYKVPDNIYKLALNIIKEHPYESVENIGRNINSKSAEKVVQEYIDYKKYKWKVKIVDNMLPRMSVNTDKTLYIDKKAKFNKDDLEGLKAHEVDGHVGRRYYGYKTGLYLFVYGLCGRNILDEGLAVWNSLNKVKKPKKNILFNIAIKTIISYNINRMNFIELFDFVKKLEPNLPDERVFNLITRSKRELIDMSLLGGWIDDASYLIGYEIVNKMNDKERDDILKYNIGPDQLDDLQTIKEFLKINNFKSLI